MDAACRAVENRHARLGLASITCAAQCGTASTRGIAIQPISITLYFIKLVHLENSSEEWKDCHRSKHPEVSVPNIRLTHVII